MGKLCSSKYIWISSYGVENLQKLRIFNITCKIWGKHWNSCYLFCKKFKYGGGNIYFVWL